MCTFVMSHIFLLILGWPKTEADQGKDSPIVFTTEPDFIS